MILVTGATGRIGRALSEVLSQGRRPVLETSLHLPPDAGAAGSAGPGLLPEEQAAEVRSIIHLSGEVPGVPPVRADQEVAAMQGLLRLGRQQEVDRFVYLSASGASPTSPVPFLRHKGQAEELLRQSGLPFVILRAGVVVVDGHPFLEALAGALRQVRELPLPWWSHGRLHGIGGADLAIALATALDHHVMPGKALDVGAGVALGLAEWATEVGRRLGRPPRLRRRPFGGRGLRRLLQRQGPLPDASTWLRWFTVAEPVDLSLHDRALPMRRIEVGACLEGLSWGPPPLKPGDPLPTVQAAGTAEAPAFIPGAHLLEPDGSDPAGVPPSRFGQVDPFGQPVEDPADEGDQSDAKNS